MSSDENRVSVTVTHDGTTVEFGGPPETVLRSINDFLLKEIPTLNLARKISVSYSTSELIQMFQDYVKMTPEGPRVWVGDKKISDKDFISLQLVACKIGHDAGRVNSEWLTLTEVQNITNLNPKSISSRLSELTKQGSMEKETGEYGVRFKITTQGIYRLSESLSKKRVRKE